MKKVLITGCSGFLAQHFIPTFQKNGYYVIGVDKRPVTYQPDKFIQADIRDLKFRDLMGIDYVVHLGWRTNIPDCSRHPEESTNDNIDMTIHLLEVCKEAKIKKFAFPSTASMYGNNPTPWTEDMVADPIEPYSWQKLSCEYLCKMYSKDVPCVIFRFFQIFGEFQREDTALAAFLRAKQDGRPITLTETTAQSSFKSGQRDFIYAGDVAEAVLTGLEKGENGEIYNVASGKIHTMEEVANVIGSEIQWIPKREYEVERHEANVDKIKGLGWKPKVSVIEWLKKQI